MRVIFDPNVIISGAISRQGAPGLLLSEWARGGFEIVVSEALLAELKRALDYPRLARLIDAEKRTVLVELLRAEAELAPDPTGPPPLRSADSGDDYLIALSAAERLPIVSGDKHLTDLAGKLPVLTPRQFLDLLPDVPPS